ncbi:MAG: OFA family MFS transporter [Eubacteriales bacterium]|nr:OFA family MFS transporter [Eubacteriales bacterium]
MNEKKIKNRWLVLFCICCNTFCFGGVYAWSAFSGGLAEYMGWDYGRVTVAYSIMLMTIAVMGLAGGALLQRFGARRLMMAAGVMWGLGWLSTGFAGSIPALYASIGLLAGCASGFGYNPGVVTAVKWFPDRKGFASGMAVGVCGVASLIVAPFANFLLTRFDVMTAFRIVGGCFLFISLATSWYIDGPPEGWLPEGFQAPKTAESTGKTWREMLGDPRFYLLWATLLCASVAGLMLIGHASMIGREVAGITAGQAALLVGIMAAANFCGRLVLGSLSDCLGRHRIVISVMITGALDMVFLSRAESFAGFVAAIVIAGVCFGGTLATFSAISSDTFGSKYNGINYSIIFTGYGIASIVGPNAATWIKNSSGSYSKAFLFAAVCSILAAGLCMAAGRMNRKMEVK